MTQLDKNLLNYLFEYDNGKLFWKNKPSKFSNNYILGQEVGDRKSIKGYKHVKIYGKPYLLHHIIYMMFHGIKPKMLDHIDGNPENNRIENLRECDFAENTWNKKSKSKHKGIFYYKDRKKCWYGVVHVRGKRFSKYFYHYDGAEKYVKELRELYHGEFARHQ